MLETIQAKVGDFSPAERRVARAVMAHYPAAGLETVAKLSERAGTSAPSVLRFASRLGFNGFPEFQQALRDELEARNASPLAAMGAGADTQRHHTSAVPGRSLPAQFVTGIERTLERLPANELGSAVSLLADTHRNVTVGGGRFTGLLAKYFVQHLMQLRPKVRDLPDAAVPRADAILRLGKRDVLVLMDYRRYESATLDAAQKAAKSGAKIILLTDRWLSPVASLATVVLPASVDSPSPYDSYVPTMAIIETLIAGVLEELGDEAARRMQSFEALSQELSLIE
ncbi:MurR/RpiR family transcriptional regulator [Paenarthrobacter sp. S56]|uniref:MurR/RpiR family transcriptional regulator n=1 Tax=Paenarthrobacter sp. S56 TaxID=3138179 RepID=UPI0032199509